MAAAVTVAGASKSNGGAPEPVPGSRATRPAGRIAPASCELDSRSSSSTIAALRRRREHRLRVQPDRVRGVGEHAPRPAELARGVRGHHRQAQPRAARRDRRRADRLGEDAALERRLGQAHAARSSPTISGTICVSPSRHREALGGELAAQRARVGAQLLARGAAARQQLERGERAGDRRRRRRRREDQRARAC